MHNNDSVYETAIYAEIILNPHNGKWIKLLSPAEVFPQNYSPPTFPDESFTQFFVDKRVAPVRIVPATLVSPPSEDSATCPGQGHGVTSPGFKGERGAHSTSAVLVNKRAFRPGAWGVSFILDANHAFTWWRRKYTTQIPKLRLNTYYWIGGFSLIRLI